MYGTNTSQTWWRWFPGYTGFNSSRNGESWYTSYSNARNISLVSIRSFMNLVNKNAFQLILHYICPWFSFMWCSWKCLSLVIIFGKKSKSPMLWLFYLGRYTVVLWHIMLHRDCECIFFLFQNSSTKIFLVFPIFNCDSYYARMQLC